MMDFITNFIFSGQVAMTMVFGMIGSVFVFAGVRSLESTRRRVAASRHVRVKVRGFSGLYNGAPDLSGRDAGFTYGYPIVEFKDPGGNRRLVKAKYVSKPPFKVGAVLMMMYDPHSQEPPEFLSPKDLYAGPYAAIAVGALLLAVALGFPIFNWKSTVGDADD